MLKNFPSANGSTDDHERPNRNKLIKAKDVDILVSCMICQEFIRTSESLKKDPALCEFLKIFMCKIQDERNLFSPIEFYCTSTELQTLDGLQSIYNRIVKLFEDVKKEHSKIYKANQKIKLQPFTVSIIVALLQDFAFDSSDIDIKGKEEDSKR